MAGRVGTKAGLDHVALRSAVAWRDLVRYRRIDTVIELFLPAPWLAGAIWFAAHGQYLLALPFTFFLFLTLLVLRTMRITMRWACRVGRRIWCSCC